MVAPKSFSPELIENGRYRYEETDEPVAAIAADFDVSDRYFRKLIVRWNWKKRKDRPPRGLPAAVRLEIEAEKAVQAELAAKAAREEVPSGKPVAGNNVASPAAAATEPAPPSVAERLEQEIERQLADVERMRTQSTGMLTPADAERTARTLASLSETLIKVQRLRRPDAPGGRCAHCAAYDDLPHDMDAFRVELARRIDAFIASRTGEATSPEQPSSIEGEAGRSA